MGEVQILSAQMRAGAYGRAALVTDHTDANGLGAAMSGDLIRNEITDGVLNVLYVGRREAWYVWTVDLSLTKISRGVSPLTKL